MSYLQLAQEANINLVDDAESYRIGRMSVTARLRRRFSTRQQGHQHQRLATRELKEIIPNPDRSIQQIARLDPFIILQNNHTAGGYC